MEQQREMRRLADSNITNNSHSSTSSPPRLPLLATRVARLPSPGRQMPTPLSTLTNDTRQLSRNRSRGKALLVQHCLYISHNNEYVCLSSYRH